MDCKKISFNTLGCRLNQSETASIKNSFRDNGYTIVNFNQPADVAVINTCTVTENGDADTRYLVNKACRINPDVRIALIGCQAQVQKADLTKLPNVRWVIGNERKMDFVHILGKSNHGEHPEVLTPTIKRQSFSTDYHAIDFKHTRANLKIQDGCDFFCLFCEIPYARGRARSRIFENILLEANALVAAQHKELVITGINVGTYEHEGKTLYDVIDALEQIDGLERIRISSIEPTTIDKRIIEKMNTSKKVCPYLHIPLQSGSDAVLKSMKRKYSTKEFESFIRDAYKNVEQICIGTDIIVGYPTETDKDFERTCDYLRNTPIHYAHVFSYSERLYANSKSISGKIDPTTKKKRRAALREISRRKRELFHRSLIGTKQRVLFEEKKSGYFTGFTDNYCRVYVKSEENLNNRLKIVHIDNVTKEGVLGTIHE